VRARIWDVIHEPNANGGWEYRLTFTDASEQRYKLSVTDLAFRYFLDREREAGRVSGHGFTESVTGVLKSTSEVYLRVGLARNWSKFPDRCYLQVNGVYSIPDYLGGRCFADLAPTLVGTPSR